MLARIETQAANTAESVATVAELALINDTPLSTGHVVWHRTLRDQYSLEKASALTLDGNNVTQGYLSDSRWVRRATAHPIWTLQDFYVDPTNGSDENIGSSGFPLKTDAEIARRWGPLARLGKSLTITYLGSPTERTSLHAQCLPGVTLKFLGTRTTVKSSTFTAVTAMDRANQIPWDVTGSGLGATDVGKIIRITAGTTANIGAYATIVKDLTGGKVRVTPFGQFTNSSGTPFVVVTPAVGDTFEVVTFPTLSVGHMVFEGSSLAPIVSPQANSVIFDSLTLDANGTLSGTIVAHAIKAYYAQSVLNFIRLAGSIGSTAYQVVCGGRLATCAMQAGSNFQVRSSVITDNPLAIANGGIGTFFADTLFQGVGLSNLGLSKLTSTGTAFFDCASDQALTVPSGGIWSQSGAIADWGTNNAGHGVTVIAAGSYLYATKPTVNLGLGAGREAKVGGTDKLWSVIPYVETANLAQIIVPA